MCDIKIVSEHILEHNVLSCPRGVAGHPRLRRVDQGAMNAFIKDYNFN